MRPLSLLTLALIVLTTAAGSAQKTDKGELFVARPLTPEGAFTEGIEGPACDAQGNVYAVNYARQQTIGKVTPDGSAEVFVTLPGKSVGNGIVFDRQGSMFVADYVGHNVLRIDPKTRTVTVFAHEGRMNQPNDLAIAPNGVLWASDPNWAKGTGQLWRIDVAGQVTLAAEDLGTTNGIEVSPGGKTLYVNESVQRNVWAFTITADGKLTDKRLVKQFPDHGFDGMRADVDGNLYVTRYGKGTVVKLSPAGEILREIDVLGASPSNLCFGGPDGRTVYVTEVQHRRVVQFRVDRPGLAWQRWQPVGQAPAPGDTMITKYLAQQTAAVSRRVLGGAATKAEWEARRPRLKQEYLDMLGLWPLPEKTPLHATVTGTLERDGVVIDKLHFQSRPGLYVTGNLYRPQQANGRLPAVLYVCGHSGRGRDGNKTAFQDHGLWFANNGYVCLIIDTLQLGEIPGTHHGTYREGRWWWQARGYTPAGVECWNGVRALDYLVSRPDVDPERLGVTGISGGGAATFWIAAADERVKCAVPVSGMSDLESYVTNQVINGHCDCMFLVNAYGWEWTTIAALVAPRPLLFANSDNDAIFPMDGNRRIIARLRQLYHLYGAPGLVDEYVSHGGHDYRPDLRVAIFAWMNQHLQNDTAPVRDAHFKPLPGPDLRVFAAEKDVPKDAQNGTMDETFVPLAELKLPQKEEFAAWRAAKVQQIRARSFRTLPERIPAATPVPPMVRPEFGRPLATEPGIAVLAGPFAVSTLDGDIGTLVVLNPEEAGRRTETLQALAGLIGGRAHALLPRGVGEPWSRKSPPNYVERAHALLGQTVDEGRVRDVAATVRFLDGIVKVRTWRVVGRGQAGVLAAYAALLEPTIGEVIAVEPPVTHRAGPIFLNVLRTTDIPEALGLLAPLPLTLVHAPEPAFDRTARLYELAGAPEKFRRAP